MVIREFGGISGGGIVGYNCIYTILNFTRNRISIAKISVGRGRCANVAEDVMTMKLNKAKGYRKMKESDE